MRMLNRDDGFGEGAAAFQRLQGSQERLPELQWGHRHFLFKKLIKRLWIIEAQAVSDLANRKIGGA